MWTFGTAPLNFHVISCFEPPCHASLSVFTWLSAPPRRPSIFTVGEPGDIRDALRAGLVEGRDVAAAAESERVINESIIEGIERLVYRSVAVRRVRENFEFFLPACRMRFS